MTNTILVRSSNPDLFQMCREAIAFGLYVRGWRLLSIFCVHIIGRKNRAYRIQKIAMCYNHNNHPVGCGVLYLHRSELIMAAYVKPKYRRKAIGRELVQALGDNNRNVTVGEGIKGSDKFWDAVLNP